MTRHALVKQQKGGTVEPIHRQSPETTLADELRAAASRLRAEAAAVAEPHQLAEPLAKTLDAVAFAVGFDDDLIHRVGYEHVLAVARVINGEANGG